MAGNKQSGETLRQTMIEKYGSEEAWKQVMRERGALGGKAMSPLKGFGSMSPEKHRAASVKGGVISRRKVKL